MTERALLLKSAEGDQIVDQKECQNAEVFPQSTFNETHKIWMSTEKSGGIWQLALS